MIDWKERQERIEARGAEYRAGAMSEGLFSAYLFSMRERGEDLQGKLRDYAPPAPALTWEDVRLEASRQWMRSYTNRLTESHDREIEAAITRFIDCGVTLDRMHIVYGHNYYSTTLYVDDVARFTWKMEYRNGNS